MASISTSASPREHVSLQETSLKHSKPNNRHQKKSRLGCQTCKARRLKCSEAKPTCSYCRRYGLECSYKSRLKFVQYDGKRNRGRQGYSLGGDDPGDEQDLAQMMMELDQSLQSKGDTPSEDPALDGALSAEEPPFERSQPAREQAVDSAPAFDLEEDLEELQRVESLETDGGDLGAAQPSPSSQVISIDGEPEDPPSQSIGSISYLQRFYGSILEPGPPKALSDRASRLVSHYFTQVCGLYAAYDSHLNPFRTTIGQLWTGSAPIYYAVQSMAAAHLANCAPNMASAGVELQQQAYSCLRSYISCPNPNEDHVLLTLLLLGLTTSWHDTGDVGHSHLSAARTVARKRIQRVTGDGQCFTNNEQFFAEALIYWEMIMSFVSPEAAGLPYCKSATPRHEGATATPKIRPHPWTGVAPDLQMLFAEVGKLLCFVRQRTGSSVDIFDIAGLNESATSLEGDLLSAHIPELGDILDTGDENTKKVDFILIAEVTRYSALLMLYRGFPWLLEARMGDKDLSNAGVPLMQSFLGQSKTEHSEWLTSLAVHGINELMKIPFTSGTRFLQLLPLCCLASDLRSTGIDGSCTTEVYEARQFTLKRLYDLAALLPSKPVLRIIDIAREVWRQSDDGAQVFWVDVMLERGWQTFMG